MTNDKKKNTKQEETLVEGVEETVETVNKEKTRMDFANDVLEQSKGRLDAVLVLGVTPSGDLVINTNVPEYPFMHYIVNRTQNELWAHENENRAKAKEQREKNG